jgi:hypothetical protein
LAVLIFLFSAMDTFRLPAQANESCEGFIGVDEKCVIFIKKIRQPEADES